MRDPYWKIALNWGAVLVFFSLPFVIFVTQLWVYPNLDQEKAHLDYLREWMRNVTLLVFGLAGLRTWEQMKRGAPPPAAEKPATETKTLEGKT
jgi:hypothetical protein